MLLLLCVILGGPVLVYCIMWNRPSKWQRELQRTGTRGIATITDVADTGVSTNGGLAIYVKLTVSVQPEGGGTPFTATLETANSRIGIMRPGQMLAVKYDWANLKHVVIDDDQQGATSMAGGSSMPVDSVLEALAGSRPEFASQVRSAGRGMSSSAVPRGVYVLRAEGERGGGDPGDASGDIAEQLTKLDELHRSGALTDAEYKAAKAKLLR
jgi:hypothetical protein